MTQIIANRYAVGQKIGSGGMGDVFRGTDQRTNNPVAIKVLKSELATTEMIARFMREGEALRQLNHPNIVSLLDAVEENDQHYLIMELVEGGALDEALRQNPRLPLKQVLNIALDLTDALTRAHRLNIIHRDIKPANVLLAKDGMPRLTDFGIAHVVGSDITETGSLMGTAAYIAPEVIQGSPADARSDIWALGVMFFEMLAGNHPFKADNPGSLIYAVLSEPLPDLEALRPDAPAALVDLINRMLMKDPAERIPRMRLVGAELEVLLSGETRLMSASQNRAVVSNEVVPVSRFATPSPVPTRQLRSNLPVQTTPFVGRENELAEVNKLLHDPSVRLLTILATGGMGKTRLALEVAGHWLHDTQTHNQFENGLYFVDLAPLSSDANMVETVAEAVGYAFQQDGREARQQLLDYLREKNALLIMDNFEHVVAGRTLVQDILQAAAGVKILATSREKLNLSAETVFILGGMEFPEWETPEDALEYSAVKLFMQSARRVRSDFELGADDLPFIARICRMVQGTPLGILLAAAWMEALSPQEITEEISRSLDFLETEMHDLPERHRSLRAVFEYSWNLLTEPERTLFAQISIFRGGFTREAAQQITGTNLRTLSVMVNKSLLHRDNESGRYEIHELLRQYAEEKLKVSPDVASTYQAHCQYYTGLLAQLAPKLKGHGQLEALNTVETDFENIRAAWNWAVQHSDNASIQQALEGLWVFLMFRNRFMDGELFFRAARQIWKADGDNVSLLAGQVLVRYPEQPPLEQFRRGLAIAQWHQAAREIAFCQRLVGHWISHTEFNQEEGIPILEASLKGYQALGDKFYVAQVMDDLGWSYNLNIQPEKHERVVQESLALRREIGDKIGIANSLRNLGGLYGGFFNPDGPSFDYWQEAKGIAYEMDDRLGVAWNAGLQAAHLLFQGDFDRAAVLADEAYSPAADINDPMVKGFVLGLKGSILALRHEDYFNARTLLQEAFPPGSNPDFRMSAVPFGMALVACGLDDSEVLRPFISLILEMPEPFSLNTYFTPLFTPLILHNMSKKGENARAVEFMFVFQKLTITYAGRSFPLGWANHWAFYNRLRDHLQTVLGAEGFQAAWERGAHRTLDELIAEVRSFAQGKWS